MKKGDLVRWKREDGGGYAYGHITSTKGKYATVEFGSGNKTMRKEKLKSSLQVRDPA